MKTPIVLPLLLVTIQVLLPILSSPACSKFSQPQGTQNEKLVLLEMAKQNILNKLHLKQRPTISHTISSEAVELALSQLKIRLNDSISGGEQDEELDNDQDYEMISFADIDSSQGSQTVLHFHLSTEKGRQQEIHNANLWIYLQSDRKKKIVITIANSLSKEKSSNDTIHREIIRSSWYTFPLPMLSKRALGDDNGNVHLSLECFNCDGHPLIGNISDVQHPFLVVKAQNQREGNRLRRHITECTSDLDMCCRRNFYIDFKEIGWSDWIISPEGYYMNFCEGRCPVHLARVPGIAASSHTAILSLIKANNLYTSFSSCCVPTKRRPLSLLFFDLYNSIVKTDIPDMIVESCGCT
ncbi:hypothetical protein GDO86_004348 [Hymenochirus boettgeri]|uniref:TGF-beta family profile domain-containing protein n=1 Tax=Hymenochirus boettgeri TaxID=247094 RepID=A0A8T2K5I4_9PIPI|nr:hypothetical protein GDO86_004348 [Hymenochirus boettgeri]